MKKKYGSKQENTKKILRNVKERKTGKFLGRYQEYVVEKIQGKGFEESLKCFLGLDINKKNSIRLYTT